METEARNTAVSDSSACWPALPLEAWQGTRDTLHMWTQIVGKVRLALAPAENHWWHVPLYLTARGLTTSAMPHDERTFQIDFDFIDHRLDIVASDGRSDSVALAPCSVAAFHAEVMARLAALGLPVRVWTTPVEIASPIRFEEDHIHAAYDPEAVHRFWRALALIDQVFKRFRGEFLGKVSPVHFFWGSFDLAVTRFSGRPAPPPPRSPIIPDSVNREAYSHEVSSAGFWPGNGGLGQAAFYSYAYPQPTGFAEAAVTTAGAYYSREIGEFLLPYDAVREAAAPAEKLLDFLRQTYAAAADLGKWDRASLECS